MKNFIDDPGYEPVNPYRFDFNIPILRYIQVIWNSKVVGQRYFSVLYASSQYFQLELSWYLVIWL